MTTKLLFFSQKESFLENLKSWHHDWSKVIINNAMNNKPPPIEKARFERREEKSGKMIGGKEKYEKEGNVEETALQP